MVDTVQIEEVRLPFALTRKYFQKLANKKSEKRKKTMQIILLGIIAGLFVGAAFGTGIGFLVFFVGGLSMAAAIGFGVGFGVVASLVPLWVYNLPDPWKHTTRTSYDPQSEFKFSSKDLLTDEITVSKTFTVSKVNKDNMEYTVFKIDPAMSSEEKRKARELAREVALDIIKSEIDSLKQEIQKLKKEKDLLNNEASRNSGNKEALASLERRMESLNISIKRLEDHINDFQTLSKEIDLKFKTYQQNTPINDGTEKIELYRSKIAQLAQEQIEHPNLKEALGAEKTKLERKLQAELSKLPKEPQEVGKPSISPKR